MQSVVFTGRLAADPQISPDRGKAVFRLLESRGTDGEGKPRVVGVNCVSWAKGLNEKVIARGLAKGCEAIVVGAFIDVAYTAQDGTERAAKELVVNRLTVLDWVEGRTEQPPAYEPEAGHRQPERKSARGRAAKAGPTRRAA